MLFGRRQQLCGSDTKIDVEFGSFAPGIAQLSGSRGVSFYQCRVAVLCLDEGLFPAGSRVPCSKIVVPRTTG